MKQIQNLALDTVVFELADGSLAVCDPNDTAGTLEMAPALVEAPLHPVPSFSLSAVEGLRLRRAIDFATLSWPLSMV